MEVLSAEQPGDVVPGIMGVAVTSVTFSLTVVFITAGVSVVWLATMPGTKRQHNDGLRTDRRCTQCCVLKMQRVAISNQE